MSKYRGQGQNPPLWVSQNFLTSRRTIERLLRRTTISGDDHVIEIGPGKGHTTGLLLQNCREVTAVEIDEALYQRLVKTFDGAGNLNLFRQDFLQWRLPARGSYKVFANIPFCHTTRILRKLAQAENPPAEAWLTMESGAAKRFLGKPGETAGSLMLKPVFDLDIAYYFCREDFYPKPGVDVVLVHLRKNRRRMWRRPGGARMSASFPTGGASA